MYIEKAKFYSVSYDLLKQKDYEPLIARLKQLGALKVEYSHWLLTTTTMDAAQIRDDLARYMDADDRLLVAGLTGEAAWRNLIPTHDAVKEVLAA